MYRLLISLVFILLFVSCDPARVYETNRDFEGALWPLADTALFTFNISDTSLQYNIWINVRNSNDFKTSRLFLKYSLADSSNNPLRNRMLEEALFNKKTGEPFGSSGLGSIYVHRFLVESNINFPAQGRYSVKLNHMMRTDTLQEILSIGARVEKVQ